MNTENNEATLKAEMRGMVIELQIAAMAQGATPEHDPDWEAARAMTLAAKYRLLIAIENLIEGYV